jgi:hypothetical protein
MPFTEKGLIRERQLRFSSWAIMTGVDAFKWSMAAGRCTGLKIHYRHRLAEVLGRWWVVSETQARRFNLEIHERLTCLYVSKREQVAAIEFQTNTRITGPRLSEEQIIIQSDAVSFLIFF